jgi:hypothetical protein
VNLNSFRSLQFNLSGVRFWLGWLAVIWLLGAVGLGWLVKSFLILIGLLLLTPVVAFFALRWWLQRNLIQEQCPVCEYEFAGLNGTNMRCPNCSEPVQIQNGHFYRLTPPGTVEVEAIEVASNQLED